jgi:UDP-N-acetylmuramoyl-L-alanyl-D-glutamate--2,6-diaminopimelate ligase
MAASLIDLVAALPHAQVTGSADILIQAITCDSRQVAPGSLFVAYRGVARDGHDFVTQALARGAAAIVAERPFEGAPVPVALVPNGREALAYLSAAWEGFPARRLTVVGVTGTDGKTTTCNLLHSILAAASRRAGLITTVNSPDVQRYLAGMAAAGLEIAVLEATSEGLAQHRVSACDFDVAAVTNVTHEHLYFHGTLEAYQQAKAMLFHHLSAGYRKAGVPKVAILNADDDSYRYLRPIPADRHLSYSLGGPADVAATGIRRGPAETRFLVRAALAGRPVLREFELSTPLVGDFNISNILAAASVALALGVPAEAIQRGVAGVRGVVGRMEPIDEGQPFAVLVDFAHTPNALQRALEAARTLARGRLIAVFGSAGERDVKKRAWMGEIGARLADVAILTAEDPRREPLDAILAEMARGAELANGVEGQTYFRVPDRAEAIQRAVDLARAGDVVIVCGKGHEQSICFGTVETPWSEHEAIRAALRKRASHDSRETLE